MSVGVSMKKSVAVLVSVNHGASSATVGFHDIFGAVGLVCSHFASHSRFVTVFSVCKVSLQSFDITPPKSFLSIIIIIIV